MDKLKLLKRASINILQLENIKIGDFIADEFGHSGKVIEIEKISCNKQFHYYFYLHKQHTILMIV